MPAFPRLATATLLAAAVGACSFDAFTYTVDAYGGVRGTAVSVGCSAGYEVFDRPEKGTMLVATNVFTEAANGTCGTGPLPLAARQRQVAEIYLAETTDRPLCRLTRDQEITDRHREFGYTCPAGEPLRKTDRTPTSGPLFGRVPVENRTRR